MKLTPNLVASFEVDQRKHGTETAIYNVIWQIAADLMFDIGVARVTTRPQKPMRFGIVEAPVASGLPVRPDGSVIGEGEAVVWKGDGVAPLDR